MKPLRLKPLLVVIVALTASSVLNAQGFNQFVGFGDSTMDSGYFRFNPTGGGPRIGATTIVDQMIKATVAAGGSGAFAGPAIVDTELLAARFGLTAMPVIIAGGGGTNYANGSAQTVLTATADGYLSGFYNNVPTVDQIANYLGSVHNVANPHALYMISTGANDLVWLQTQSRSTSPGAQTQAWAHTLASSVANLQAAGARSIVVNNTYFYADLVQADRTLNSVDSVNYGEAQIYGAQIWDALAAAGVNFMPADIDGLLKYVSQNPAKFGFTAANVLASNAACGNTGALVCSPSQLVSSDAEQTHLFSDSKHLTTAGQKIETDYIYNLLAAPREISLISESALQGGLALAATIQGQLDYPAATRGSGGINLWVSAGANAWRLQNGADFTHASGVPAGGSIGADFQTRHGLILGGALTSGGQAQQFSSGGSFNQVAEALSLYAGYKRELTWVDAVADYGLYQNSIVRPATLGNFTDQDRAHADGQSVALALRGGHYFRFERVMLGPVVGVAMQHVHMDGFTESGDTGITALQFDSQKRGSAVSQAGWRGTMNIGNWRPFSEMEWNHELAGNNESVRATLTSIAAPSYSTAAASLGSDWATASLGSSYRLSSQVTLTGSLSALFINPRVSTYGGSLSVSFGF